MILGTAAYMSPEQAAGSRWISERISGRSAWCYRDGHREAAFGGETVSHTLAAVLTKDPDWKQLPAGTPAAIRRLLRRCLERDRKRRLPDIGSARLEIDEAAGGGAGSADWAGLRPRPASFRGECAAARRWWRGRLPSAHGWYWRATQPVERPLVRLDVDLGPDVSLPSPSNFGGSVGLSPDGTRLAYASGNPARIVTRRLDQPTAIELSGTEGAAHPTPFFSPDGQWLGFFTNNKVVKISVQGGAVVPLAERPFSNIRCELGRGWQHHHRGCEGSQGGLARIPEGGGRLHGVDGIGQGRICSCRSPDSPRAVKRRCSRSMERRLTPTTPTSKRSLWRTTEGRSWCGAARIPAISPSGHLVYGNKGTLFAIPFDPVRLETHGAAVPVLDDVAYATQTAFADVDSSANGTLVYRRGSGGWGAGTVHHSMAGRRGQERSAARQTRQLCGRTALS